MSLGRDVDGNGRATVAGGARSGTSDDDSAVLATVVGTVAVGASHDGVSTSVNTGRNNTGRVNTSASRTASLVLADTLSVVNGGFLLLFGTTGLNAGCESQQGDRGSGEVHFY